jgi:hypothetical protein
MSSQSHDTQQQEIWQEVDTSDEDWNELVANRLPANVEMKAIELKAWSRQREVRSIRDVLRALLVLAALGFSCRTAGDVGNAQRDRPYVRACMAQADAAVSGLDRLALVRTTLSAECSIMVGTRQTASPSHLIDRCHPTEYSSRHRR